VEPPKYRSWFIDLRKRAPELGIPLDVPWRELSAPAQEIVLRGKGGFEGVSAFLRRWIERSTSSMCE